MRSGWRLDLAERLERRVRADLASFGRRRVRQREAEDAHGSARARPTERNASARPASCAAATSSGGRVGRRVLEQQPLPDADAQRRSTRSFPTDGLVPKSLVAILQVVEAQRVRQRERRRVDQAVQQRQIRGSTDTKSVVPARNQTSTAPARWLIREELLRREVAVGDLPGDERTEDRADRAGREDRTRPGRARSPRCPSRNG